jgi:hypothetical protein
LSMTDNDVLVAMAEAGREPRLPGHEWASRL